METFITTIELREANEQDYDILHSELKKESFQASRKYISRTSGVETRKEEYNKKGNISLHDVTASLLRALVKTGKKFSFTIIKGKGHKK